MIMKKIVSAIIALAVLLCFAGCGVQSDEVDSQTKKPETSSGESAADDKGGEGSSDGVSKENEEMKSKILVAYFSRADENYGVGNIEYGNTHIIADMIAGELGADMFEIVRVTPYPTGYRDCTDEAKREQNENARPALTSSVENFDNYDIIFLGYPNWWGDMPMPVYTFPESYDFSGKTVVPFCTHAGSGLSSTVRTLTNKLTGAKVLEGLAVLGTTAQNDRTSAKAAVDSWLSKLNFGGAQ